MVGHRFGFCVSLTLICLVGCSTTRTSDTSRTGLEQLLISNAVDQALNKVDFTPFVGKAVYLDEKYLECTDKNYVIASIRHRLFRHGATVAAKREEADVVLEVRSGAVGTDNSDSYIGIPEVVLPGIVTLPEVRFFTRTRQHGTAKLGLVAYDAKTSRQLGDGGVTLARSHESNLYLFGVGPFQSGSVREEMSDALDTSGAYPEEELPMHVSFRVPQPATPAPEPATAPVAETLPAGFESWPAHGSSEFPRTRRYWPGEGASQ
jgi:hypothetical protein